jgi:hypothetical protein
MPNHQILSKPEEAEFFTGMKLGITIASYDACKRTKYSD